MKIKIELESKAIITLEFIPAKEDCNIEQFTRIENMKSKVNEMWWPIIEHRERRKASPEKSISGVLIRIEK